MELLGLGTFFLLLILAAIGLNIWAAFLMWDILSRIPAEKRTIEPYFPWLTLIPVAGFVFQWIIIPFKLPETLKNHFLGSGDLAMIESTRKIGLWYMITLSCTIIPLLNFIAWIPALVFFIILLVKLVAINDALPAKVTSNQKLKTSNYEQISKLKELYDSGAITEEEFNSEKNKILN
jgi:uncharacterized membrane protein